VIDFARGFRAILTRQKELVLAACPWLRLCRAQPYGGKQPPPELVVQLEEARQEYRRRKNQQALKF